MSLLREDLYVVFGGTVDGTEQAVFRFTINPLVWWVWYGGMIVALGGLIVMWAGGGAPPARRGPAGGPGGAGGGKKWPPAPTPRRYWGPRAFSWPVAGR